MMPRYNIDMARTLHGYRKDTDSTHKKWSDMIRHNRSIILKYPGILALDMTWIQSHVYGIKCQGTGLQTWIGFIAKIIMKKLHYMAPLKDLSRTDKKWVDVLEDYSLVLVVEPIWHVPISESPLIEKQAMFWQAECCVEQILEKQRYKCKYTKSALTYPAPRVVQRVNGNDKEWGA